MAIGSPGFRFSYSLAGVAIGIDHETVNHAPYHSPNRRSKGAAQYLLRRPYSTRFGSYYGSINY
jgi:hypothetical protein